MNKYFIDFTNNNIKSFTNKCKIKPNNLLLQKLKSERSNIKKFIKDNTFKINLHDGGVNILDKKIKEYADNFFVDKKGVLTSLDSLPEEYEFTWSSNGNINKITVKSTSIVKEYLKKKNRFINIYDRISKI